MIFALDFDRTLFDTDRYLSHIRERGLEHEKGDPKVHLSVDPAPFLYGDVMPFFNSLAHKDVVFVVSFVTQYGPLSEAYQRDKIVRTGISSMVREVILTGESKVAALEKITVDYPYDEIVFVDDMVDHLVAVREALPRVHCIHMERVGAKRNSTVLVPNDMQTVHSLTELLQVLPNITI